MVWRNSPGCLRSDLLCWFLCLPPLEKHSTLLTERQYRLESQSQRRYSPDIPIFKSSHHHQSKNTGKQNRSRRICTQGNIYLYIYFLWMPPSVCFLKNINFTKLWKIISNELALRNLRIRFVTYPYLLPTLRLHVLWELLKNKKVFFKLIFVL